MQLLYNVVTLFLLVAGLPLWLILTLLSPKRRRTVLYRLGLRSLDAGARPDEPLEAAPHIWIHALSVGELNGAESLIKMILARHPDWRLTISVSTLSGFELARQKLARQVHHLTYFPYDFYPCVRWAVHRIDPTMTVWVESDIWPNLLSVLSAKKVPMVLANARLSERSFRGYRRLSWIFSPMFDRFRHIAAQSQEDARRFSALGVPDTKLSITGNIKFDQSEEPSSTAEHLLFKERLGAQKGDQWMVWGSTHPGEEALLLKACDPLLKQRPNLRLLVAPRDPARALEIRDLFFNAGWATDLWTQRGNASSGRRYRVVVIDVIGVLRGLYALADVALIGGSFLDHGGHNPLEAAFYAKPIIYGPYMGNFGAVSQMLLRAGGALQVSRPRQVGILVSKVLTKGKYARAMGANAHRVFEENAGAVERTLVLIQTCLSR